jgi:O-antigen/teichoic acid export membrane protein
MLATSSTKHKRPARRIGSIVAQLASVNALVLAFSLLTGPLLARSLGPSGRGAVAAVAAPVGLAPYILGFGLPTFITREAARGSRTGDLLGSAGIIIVAVGALGIVLAQPVADYFAQGRAPVRVALLISMYTLPISLLATLLVGLANGQQRWKLLIATRLTPALFGLVATVVLYLTHMLNVDDAIAIVLVSGYLSIVPSLGVLRGVWPLRVRKQLMGASIRFGLPAWLWQISSITNVRLDQIMMVSLTSSSQLGLYAVAVSLASISTVFAGALGPALLPRVTSGGARLVTRVCSVTLVVTLLINLALAALSPLVLPLLFGSQFDAAVPMACILAAGAVPYAGTQVLTASLLSAGLPRRVAVSEAATVVVTIGGLLALVGPLGGVGASLVSAVAYTITFTILLVGASKHFDVRIARFIHPEPGDLRVQGQLVANEINTRMISRLRRGASHHVAETDP